MYTILVYNSGVEVNTLNCNALFPNTVVDVCRDRGIKDAVIVCDGKKIGLLNGELCHPDLVTEVPVEPMTESEEEFYGRPIEPIVEPTGKVIHASLGQSVAIKGRGKKNVSSKIPASRPEGQE